MVKRITIPNAKSNDIKQHFGELAECGYEVRELLGKPMREYEVKVNGKWHLVYDWGYANTDFFVDYIDR